MAAEYLLNTSCSEFENRTFREVIMEGYLEYVCLHSVRQKGRVSSGLKA